MATKKIKIIITPIDNLVKVFNSASSWSTYFKGEQTCFGLLDEIELCGVQDIAALVSFFDAYIAGGDHLQRPWQEQR